MSHTQKATLATVLCVSAIVNVACIKPLGTRILIQTWVREEDDLLGVSEFRDPFRGYYGFRNTNVPRIERNGYETVNGNTNANAQDQRSELSVPNEWVFLNTNGDCTNMITFHARLADRGIADLKCRIYTGYNRNQW